jgi:hypothetical protein
LLKINKTLISNLSIKINDKFDKLIKREVERFEEKGEIENLN